jgi:hypothetical protein
MVQFVNPWSGVILACAQVSQAFQSFGVDKLVGVSDWVDDPCDCRRDVISYSMTSESAVCRSFKSAACYRPSNRRQVHRTINCSSRPIAV